MIFFKILVGILVLGITDADDSNSTCPTHEHFDRLTQDKFIAYLTDPCRYDKNNIPTVGGEPLNVTVKTSITHLDSTQSQFTAYLTIQLDYIDPKLDFSDISAGWSMLVGGETLKNLIWTPNYVMKDGGDTSVLSMQQKEVLVKVDKTGAVSYGFKLVVTFNCRLNLEKFPFDTQRCVLAFSDWSYANDKLRLIWDTDPTSDAKGLHFSEYVMDGVNNLQEKDVDTDVGVFSEVTMTMCFYRDTGYYLLDFFIPSLLLVCTAWVTFWLQADATPPRATLGVSTIISFITLHLGVTKDIPRVSYVKASDIWFLAINMFIFSSLVEFAFVNVIWRRKKPIHLRKEKPKYILKSAVMPRKARDDLKKFETRHSLSIISNSSQGNFKNSDLTDSAISIPDENPDFQWREMTPQEVAIYIDRKARIWFPVAFAVFNVLYWLYVFFM